jgi:hypothetical protein
MPNNSKFILRLEQVHENNPTKKTTYDNESSFIKFSLYMSKSSESKLSCWIKILKIYQLVTYWSSKVITILDTTFWLY